MQVNSKFYQKGFTLIELMVVMAIISIIATITFAGYSGFNQQQQINIAYEDLRSNLAEAKSSAISQVVSEGCRMPNRLFNGYQLSLPSDSDSKYVIEEVCTEGASATPNVFIVKKEVDLANGLTVSISPTSPRYIRFKPLLGGVGANSTITLSNGTVSQNEIITISAEGNIQ